MGTSALRAEKSTVDSRALRRVRRLRRGHNMVIFASPSFSNRGVEGVVRRTIPKIGRTFLGEHSTIPSRGKDLKIRRTSPRTVQRTLHGLCARRPSTRRAVAESSLFSTNLVSKTKTGRHEERLYRCLEVKCMGKGRLRGQLGLFRVARRRFRRTLGRLRRRG